MVKFLKNYRTFLSNRGNYYVVVLLNILIVIKTEMRFCVNGKDRYGFDRRSG